jgi:hypothetical protein
MADGNAPLDGPPFSAARPASGNRHRARIERCLHCDVPTEHKLRKPGCYPPVDYDWCPRCGMAMWCACEGCEVLRALARLQA